MPEYVLDLVADALNDRAKPLRGSRVLVLGVTYKRDVEDVRGSPAIDIISLLLSKGAQADYHDPYIKTLEISEHAGRRNRLDRRPDRGCIARVRRRGIDGHSAMTTGGSWTTLRRG